MRVAVCCRRCRWPDASIFNFRGDDCASASTDLYSDRNNKNGIYSEGTYIECDTMCGTD